MSGRSQEAGLPRWRGLADAFAGARDPRIGVLEGFPVGERFAGALLATVLGQDMKIGSLGRLLLELRRRLGDRLFALETSDWMALERACRIPWLAEWPHREALAGWVLAVSDFLRVHGPVQSWPMPAEGPRELVHTLARELPWMGSRSPYKVKGWRLLRWLVRGELGEAVWDRSARARLVVPVAAVERPLRSLGWLPADWGDRPAAARQAWFDERAGRVSPDDPGRLWVPLETVLARGARGPACQELLGGCSRCPVRDDCPTPGRN